MRRSGSHDGMTVRAVAGSHTVLLGIDLTAAARAGCLGFSIARTELGAAGDAVWLRNRLRFPEGAEGSGDGAPQEGWDFAVNASAAPAPMASAATTEWHPWQAFRYVDADVEPGRRYRYRVVARRGRSDRLEDGAAVELTVATEDTGAEATAVFLNRAAAASPQYIERFRDVDPDESPEARRWLSRGLEEGLLAFLARAKDARFKLHVAIYEFQKRELLDALAAARDRGVEVRVVYHGRRRDERDRTAGENREAARLAGISALCTPRVAAPGGGISHNKFVVLHENGAPAAVWTGSTNWTDGALYGQLNVGHAVYRADVAGHFERYFQLLAHDLPGAQVREALDRSLPVSAVRAAHAAGPGVWPVFSPQRSLEAVEFYAEVCARARSLMVCAPFLLHEKIRAALLKDRAEAGAAGLRFLLLDRPGNLGDAEGVDLLDARGGVDVSVATALKTPLHDYQRRQLAGRESFHHAGVHLHAKLILADPLGPDPTVITGSANYSESSTTDNDENTLVLRGDAAVADIYATEFMRVFDAYHFRGRNAQREAAGRPLQLATDDRWSERYYAPPGPDGDRAAARRLFAGTAG